MGRIVVTEFLSLDGVMEEPRWTFDFDRGEAGDKFKMDELFDATVLLLGRVTYQGFAAAWPNMGGDDFGKRMNAIPKYVVSSTLSDEDATWGETTVLRGDVVRDVSAARDEVEGNLLVEGSAQLVQTLAQHDLVDEYRLMVFPVVLGNGKRLFPDGMPAPAKLALGQADTSGSGVLLLTYHKAG
ncbi:MAG TPA: pyrimidine reductase [Acidimicrobiaceae bacterium]|nr:pyrimidine reductase [Acidimicrobiaceae bacterium]